MAQPKELTTIQAKPSDVSSPVPNAPMPQEAGMPPSPKMAAPAQDQDTEAALKELSAVSPDMGTGQAPSMTPQERHAMSVAEWIHPSAVVDYWQQRHGQGSAKVAPDGKIWVTAAPNNWQEFTPDMMSQVKRMAVYTLGAIPGAAITSVAPELMPLAAAVASTMGIAGSAGGGTWAERQMFEHETGLEPSKYRSFGSQMAENALYETAATAAIRGLEGVVKGTASAIPTLSYEGTTIQKKMGDIQAVHKYMDNLSEAFGISRKDFLTPSEMDLVISQRKHALGEAVGSYQQAAIDSLRGMSNGRSVDKKVQIPATLEQIKNYLLTKGYAIDEETGMMVKKGSTIQRTREKTIPGVGLSPTERTVSYKEPFVVPGQPHVTTAPGVNSFLNDMSDFYNTARFGTELEPFLNLRKDLGGNVKWGMEASSEVEGAKKFIYGPMTREEQAHIQSILPNSAKKISDAYSDFHDYAEYTRFISDTLQSPAQRNRFFKAVVSDADLPTLEKFVKVSGGTNSPEFKSVQRGYFEYLMDKHFDPQSQMVNAKQVVDELQSLGKDKREMLFGAGNYNRLIAASDALDKLQYWKYAAEQSKREGGVFADIKPLTKIESLMNSFGSMLKTALSLDPQGLADGVYSALGGSKRYYDYVKAKATKAIKSNESFMGMRGDDLHKFVLGITENISDSNVLSLAGEPLYVKPWTERGKQIAAIAGRTGFTAADVPMVKGAVRELKKAQEGKYKGQKVFTPSGITGDFDPATESDFDKAMQELQQ